MTLGKTKIASFGVLFIFNNRIFAIMAQEQENEFGRPTKYDESYNQLAYRLCLTGKTFLWQFSVFFEVPECEKKQWIILYPEFALSIEKGCFDSKMIEAEAADKREKRRENRKLPANREKANKYQKGFEITWRL